MGQQQLILRGLFLGLLLMAALSVRAATAPDWQQLTPQQQTALAPVAGRWNGMSATLRQRLLTAAAKYPAMRPDQQKRFQRHLLTWSSLTQAQRDQARKNYLKIKHLPPDRRQKVKQRLLAAHPPATAPAGTLPATLPVGNAQPAVEPIPVKASADGKAKPIPAATSNPGAAR